MNATPTQSQRPEISPTSKMRPVPPTYEHIQVNGCNTPGCENFGVTPREGEIVRGIASRSISDGYQITGVGSANLKCNKCGGFSRLKSNKGIHEELRRQVSYLWVQSPLKCPDELCANHLTDRQAKQFRKYGKTHSGSDRWQCLICKKTFSLGKPTKGHKKPHKNMLAFDLLVNKVPISRMKEILDISFQSLYGKIDFIYEQCKLFAASREAKLPSMDFDRLYLCTDRQDYMVNWGDRSARKTVQLTAIATADLHSGFIFGMMPNYDKSIEPEDLEAAVLKSGDALKPYALRDSARLWTVGDYSTSVFRSATGSAGHSAREDMDAPELLTALQQLPEHGVQVHADYLMHGHYWMLRYLLPGAKKLRFFLDGDQGLLSACMGAFASDVADRRVDVVVVSIDKELTVVQRRRMHANARAWFEHERLKYPALDSKEARTAIMAAKIAGVRDGHPTPLTALQSTKLAYPFPDMAEPEKHLRYVTDYGDFTDDHTANLLIKATLWPVDTVFNRIRRRIALCERPIRSVRRASGLWHIYAPYNPAMIEKLLTIYRVWNNYVWVSPKTKKTAAMGIGLALGPIRTQDILYFDVRDNLP